MDELGPFLRKNGFKIGNSTIEKMTAPRSDTGPPFRWFGPFKLYDDETTLAWAQGLLHAQREPFVSASARTKASSTKKARKRQTTS
jgi:hypothetical protein